MSDRWEIVKEVLLSGHVMVRLEYDLGGARRPAVIYFGDARPGGRLRRLVAKALRRRDRLNRRLAEARTWTAANR